MEKLLTQLNIRWKIFVTFKRITGHTHSHTQIVKLDDVSDIPLHEKIFHWTAKFRVVGNVYVNILNCAFQNFQCPRA